MKHTQGNWEIKDKPYTNEIFITSENKNLGYVIAVIETSNIDDDSKYEAEANAKLIAAAPELLFSLQMLVNYIERNDWDIINLATLIKEAKETIQKATQ